MKPNEAVFTEKRKREIRTKQEQYKVYGYDEYGDSDDYGDEQGSVKSSIYELSHGLRYVSKKEKEEYTEQVRHLFMKCKR